jgi:GMP synthase-like glutamine amidotransferase
VARIALLDLNGGKPNQAVELLLTAIAAAGHESAVVDVIAGDPLPSDPAAIVTSGGPGSPHAQGSWQAPLRTTLRRALLRETPLLTICLGFQVIAGELGSRVGTLAEPRFGVYPLDRTPAGGADTLLGGATAGAAFEQRRWGVWHGDLQVLATGPEGDTTCARLGPAAWGCIFHPEATQAALAAWVERPEPARKLRARGGQDLVDQTVDRLPQVQAVHEALLQGWLSWLD